MRSVPRPTGGVLLRALLLILGGCDLFGGGDTVVTGVVVNAATGEPLEGIGVVLEIGTGSFGGYVTVAEDLTDSEGRFRLRHDAATDSDGPIFVANANPYNPSFSQLRSRVSSGDFRTLRVELDPLGN